MSITGSDNGLISNNQFGKKVESLLTVDRLKIEYLQGVKLQDRNNKEVPKEFFESAIVKSVAWLEHFLDISITPVRNHLEDIDYRRNDYFDWGFMELPNYPVIKLNSLKMVYFRDSTGTPESLIDIPPSWIRLDNHSGIIRLIPNSRFLAPLQVGNNGFFPEMLRTDMVPHMWRVDYDFGFSDGKVPVLINHAVGLMAGVFCLSALGNLILPPGLSNYSISADGLSQSVSSVKSATSSAYAAMRNEYLDALQGKDQNDSRGILKILRDYYKSGDITII